MRRLLCVERLGLYMADIFDIFKKIESEREKTQSSPVSFLIVGLGNPGKKYENTRHNAGFCAIDSIAEQLGVKINKSKFNALVCETMIANSKVLLMKPQTFMNASGEAVASAASFYKLDIHNIIVISDDINLDPGRMRMRLKGSDGGQRGLRSIIDVTGSDEFCRIRIGVGKKPNPEYDLAAWVLGTLSEDDRQRINALYPTIIEGITKVILGEHESAIQLCNSKKS